MDWKVCLSSISMMAADGVPEVKRSLAGCRAKSDEPSGVVSQVATFWACEVIGRSRAAMRKGFAILCCMFAPGCFCCEAGSSGELQGPEIVEVDDSLGVPVGCGDDE